MGGPAGSGGSDRSDEKTVDTYADQLKKIQKKKNKKPTIIDTLTPTPVKVIKEIGGNFFDRTNLEKRMKFANKNKINIQGLSTEEILSKEFRAKLDAKGYVKGAGTNIKDNNGGNDNNNQPVIVQKNVGGKTVQTTEAKVAEDKKEATLYDPRKTKKKGRRKTMLTSAKGITKTSADYSLGKPTLLGKV